MVSHIFQLLLLLLLFVVSSLVGSSASDRHSSNRGSLNPQELCGGKKMYYTPLVRSHDQQELGVCDSSCKAVNDRVTLSTYHSPREESPHDILAHVSHPINRRMASSKRQLLVARSPHKRGASSSAAFKCDDTKTLPEDGVPDEIAGNFPFNSMTCWVMDGDGYEAQIAFEDACNQAQGQFTNPYYKTW